jgi:hypothetical protein
VLDASRSRYLAELVGLPPGWIGLRVVPVAMDRESEWMEAGLGTLLCCLYHLILVMEIWLSS